MVVDELLSPLRRYFTSGTTDETPVDCPDSDRSGPPRKQSPEDHVLELLRESGGRMWQQSIVAETEYSEPHISRLLCRLEDDDIVERQWIKGQKVVVMTGESIETAGSAPAASA